MQIINAIGKGIMGLLTGASANMHILPFNKYISDYNMKDGSLFKVKLQAFKVPDVTISTSSDGIKVDKIPDPNSLGEFEILYSQDSLNITHSHTYGEAGGYVGGIVNSLSNNGIMGLGGKQLDMVKGAYDLLKNIGSGQGGSTTFNTDWNTTGSLDIAKSYQGSEAPPFSISFTVLATENPLLEVIAPAVFLTYLSYPRLSQNKGVRELAKMLDEQGSSLLKSGMSLIGLGESSDGSAKISESQKSAKSALQSASNLFTGISDGKWRYRVGDTPPYWKISTSNGLYNLNNASLQSVSIDYHGPWLEAPKGASILGALQSFASVSKAGFDPSSIFPSSSIVGSLTSGLSSLSSILGGSGKKNGGYPSYATITLHFINNFNIVFGEEWLTALTGDSNTNIRIF